MFPKGSLSIQLAESVIPLHTPRARSSRYDANVLPPPAVVRGVLTLKLTKPTKISSIELELQAEAITDHASGAEAGGPGVIDQYKVHSTSITVFKSGPGPRERRCATSTRPGAQASGDLASDAQHGAHTDLERWQTPALLPAVTHSASLDPRRDRRSISSIGSEMSDGGRRSKQNQIPIDSAPPYFNPPNLYPLHNLQLGLHPIASSPTEQQSSLTSGACSIHDAALSRTSSTEDSSEDGSNDSVTPSESAAYRGLSGFTTTRSLGRSSEQVYRDRSHSRFSFRKVVHALTAAKKRVRSRSPCSRPKSNDCEECGRPFTKGQDKTQVSRHGLIRPLPQIEITEQPSSVDSATDQKGNGWTVFPEGTYTYPILFTIPTNSPPTMNADFGSLIWKVKAEARRAGAFNSRMTAQKQIIVVCVPKDDDSEGIYLQRQLEGLLQCQFWMARCSVPIGGKTLFQLTIMPLARIRIHSLRVYLDERTGYCARNQSRVQSDSRRRTTLLVLMPSKPNERRKKPVLPPTSDESGACHKSPLYCYATEHDNESGAASSMGPRPWILHHQLKIPGSCSKLHPTNQTEGSNVIANHTLRLVMRIEKEGETTATREINIPIQILSCRCTSKWMSLPGYDEASWPENEFLDDISMCPCRARRRAKAQAYHRASDSPVGRILWLETATSNSSRALNIVPSESLASSTYLHEQLITGMVSETGEVPPSYQRFGPVYG